VDCINLAQDTHQKLILANKTMRFRIKKKNTIQALFRKQLSNISVSTRICSPRRRWFVNFVLPHLYGVRNNNKIYKDWCQNLLRYFESASRQSVSVFNPGIIRLRKCTVFTAWQPVTALIQQEML
jgi:hypothetical protein